jgi:hypothetical protein
MSDWIFEALKEQLLEQINKNNLRNEKSPLTLLSNCHSKIERSYGAIMAFLFA